MGNGLSRTMAECPMSTCPAYACCLANPQHISTSVWPGQKLVCELLHSFRVRVTLIKVNS